MSSAGVRIGAVTRAGVAAALGLAHAADLAPFGRARDVEATVWLPGMAHQYPARYQGMVPDMVASALGTVVRRQR